VSEPPPAPQLTVEVILHGPDGVPVALSAWLTGIQQQLQSLLAADPGLRAELAGLRARDVVPPAVEELQRRIQAVDHRLNDLLDRIDGADTAGRRTAQDMAHYEHANEFRTLVGQKVLMLVRSFRPHSLRPLARRKAELVAAVCRELFDTDPPDPRRLAARLDDMEQLPEGSEQRIAELCAAATALRAKAGTGQRQHWRFDARRGAPPDAATQDLWVGSADDGVIDFVVVPAYVAGGAEPRQHTQQQVFTVEPRR